MSAAAAPMLKRPRISSSPAPLAVDLHPPHQVLLLLVLQQNQLTRPQALPKRPLPLLHRQLRALPALFPEIRALTMGPMPALAAALEFAITAHG
jgi:hypothetical protein